MNLWDVCFRRTPQEVWSMRDKINSRLLEYGPELPFTNCTNERWMFSTHGLILAYARVLENVEDPRLRAEGYDYIDMYSGVSGMIVSIDWPARRFLSEYYTDMIVAGKYELNPNHFKGGVLFLILRNLLNIGFISKDTYHLQGHKRIRFLTLVGSEEEVFDEIVAPGMFTDQSVMMLTVNDMYKSSIIFMAAEVSKSMVRVVVEAFMMKKYTPQDLMTMIIRDCESSNGSNRMEWYDYYKGPNCDYSYWMGPVVGVIGSPYSVKMIIEVLTELGASLSVTKTGLGTWYLSNVNYVEWVMNSEDEV